MRTADSFFSSILQDNPVYRLSVIGVAILLAGVLIFFLSRKLRSRDEEEQLYLEDEEDSFTISEEAISQAFPPHLRPAMAKVAPVVVPSRPVPAPAPEAALVPAVAPIPLPEPVKQVLAATQPSQPAAKQEPVKPAVTQEQVKPVTQPVFNEGKPAAQPMAVYKAAPAPVVKQAVVSLNGGINGHSPAPTINSTFSAQVNGTVNSPAKKDNSQVDAILNSLTDLIFEFNEQKVCLNVWYNKSRSVMVDLDGFVGKTVTENIGAENAAEMNNALDEVIRTHKSAEIEFLSFLGSGRWFSAKFNPVFDAGGRYSGRITASVSEISELKRYAAELKDKQQQLIEAQKIARIGNWWFDLQSKETYWSENLYNLLEIGMLPPGVKHFDYYAKQVHAEDRRGVYQFFANVATGPLREFEHRMVTARGNQRYFKILRGEPVRDDKGNIVRVTGIIKDVSETRQSERAIKKSQAELLEAQTIAKIGNWKWYFEHKTLSWSDEVYHIHEVPPTHQMQRGISHFKLLLKHVHPDDKNILLDFLKDPANLRRTSYEYRIITPSQYVKYLSIIIGKVRYNEDGTVRNVVGTLQDVTDRKTAQLNIQQTEDNYKQVFERIRLAAISLDHEGRIIFCNKHLANLLGYTQQSMKGLYWFKHFVPDNLKDMFKEWFENSDFKLNYVNPVICSNGEQRIISWQNTVIFDERGRIKQVTSIGEDVTDQQKDRQNLITAKEEAERSSSFKSEFLSIMSHEIRTPMNAVIGTTNLLLEESPREDQLPYLNNLKFSGESLLSIIDEILDYNKIEAGKLELSKHPLNIHQLIANIRQSFHARAAEKKIGLFTDIDSGIPISLRGDPIRLGQIINNLVSNAIKFTSQGNVTIKARERRRTDSQISVEFTITDTGIGIEPENLERIFEPFVQETREEHYGGSGLGLAIVKRLIGLHNSEIKAVSALGKGTQFNFKIDFDYIAEPPVPNAAMEDPIAIINTSMLNGSTATQTNGVPVAVTGSNGVNGHVLNGTADLSAQTLYTDLTGMKVLVVDDNKMNILIANRFLHKWKIATHEACNGANAVEMVSNNSYDLVIMDLQMPVMDGFEATKAIKQSHPGLPVIALTADAMPETFVKARNSGMDDYLTKPFMPEMLFEKVSKYYKN